MPPTVFTLETSSEEETIQAGRDLAPRLAGIVLLSGELGAGKTTLVHGIVSAIKGARADEVSSPTFTLVHDYGAKVFHLDLYRLETEREIDTLGLDELFDTARLVLIEWGEKLGNRWSDPVSTIHIEHSGDDVRTIHVRLPAGP